MPNYDENNGNEPSSEFSDKISSLRIGKEITIQKSDEPDYESLKNIVPPLGDGCMQPCYGNGSGPCRYSVPVKGETYFFEVKEDNGTVYLKRVENKAPNGHDHFDMILGFNH